MPDTGIQKKSKFKDHALTAFLIVVVCFIQGLAINGLYVPHGFLSGGITGLSLLLDYTLEVPTWITIIVLNIPVFLVAWKRLKGEFIIFSLFSTLVFAAAIELTRGFTLPVENPLLAAMAGAAIIGVSGAPVVKRNASLGGTDVIAVMLSRRYSIPMGTFNIMFNVIIMSVLGVVSGIELALSSMFAMFVANVAFNFTVQGLNRSVTVFIISDRWDEIAPLLLKDLHRGVTYIPAEGAYTGQPRKLVYSIVKTSELALIKRIVKEHDPKALFSIIEAKEVVGRGFGSLN